MTEPFLWSEIRDHIELSKYHSKGGFPRSLLSRSNEDSFEWRMDFIQDFLERGIPFLSQRIYPQLVDRLLQMICHSHGQLLNVNTFAASLGIDNKTVRKIIDLLEGAQLWKN